MNGVLAVDKPDGLTSHDVVAIARRVLRCTSIGHTGTLDPMATGVLPLVCGKATRLARFLTASDKEYEVVARFGVATDSYDITGRVLAESSERPTRDALDAAVAACLGERLQTPPVYSAKKVKGHRAYELARKEEAVDVPPARVTLSGADILAWNGTELTLRLVCSTGFYVRSLVHELGQMTGTGATVVALRRTRVGAFLLSSAVDLSTLAGAARPGAAADAVARAFIPLDRLLPELPAVQVGAEGLARVRHGQDLLPAHCVPAVSGRTSSGEAAIWTRVLGPDATLVAIASGGPDAGALHPAVVLT
jgi:tRNA pseudouridine55 synthase